MRLRCLIGWHEWGQPMAAGCTAQGVLRLIQRCRACDKVVGIWLKENLILKGNR